MGAKKENLRGRIVKTAFFDCLNMVLDSNYKNKKSRNHATSAFQLIVIMLFEYSN